MASYGQCACCRRVTEVLNAKVPDGLPSGLRMCATCSKHGGPMRVAKREADHLQLWDADKKAAVAMVWQEARREVEKRTADMKRQVIELEQILADRPTEVVERHVGQDSLQKAQTSREAALHSRDLTLRTLLELKLLHRDVGGDRCGCGLQRSRCAESNTLEQHRLLERWEKWQVDKIRAHQPHMLPDNHPKVLDRRWMVENDFDAPSDFKDASGW